MIMCHNKVITKVQFYLVKGQQLTTLANSLVHIYNVYCMYIYYTIALLSDTCQPPCVCMYMPGFEDRVGGCCTA